MYQFKPPVVTPLETVSVNKVEAGDILTEKIAEFGTRSYGQLCAMVGAPKLTFEVIAASGTRYYVDIRVSWDDRPMGDVRIVGNIDDGGWRAYFPLTDSFIKEPDAPAGATQSD